MTPRCPTRWRLTKQTCRGWTVNPTGPLIPAFSQRARPGRATRSRGKAAWTSRCLWSFLPGAPEREPGYRLPNSSAHFSAGRSSATPSRPSRGRTTMERGAADMFYPGFRAGPGVGRGKLGGNRRLTLSGILTAGLSLRRLIRHSALCFFFFSFLFF